MGRIWRAWEPCSAFWRESATSACPSRPTGRRATRVSMADRWVEEWTQLATRIPKELHQRLRLHCVETDTKMMDFVVTALREKLTKTTRRKRDRAQLRRLVE